jgi:hypothetical protein
MQPNSTPEPQSSAQGCLLGLFAMLVLIGLFCFAVAALIVTVQWALAR